MTEHASCGIYVAAWQKVEGSGAMIRASVLGIS
jgi:hypothetical protein